MGAESWIKHIIPPKSSAPGEDVFAWRVVVAIAVTLLFTALLGFALWSTGWLLGLSGFAYADDVEEKIEQAIEPINTKLSAIDKSVTIQSGYLEQLVKSDFATRIDREIRARCSATTREEKARIKSAIDTYQQGYEAVAGDKYDEPDCEDL